MREQLSVSRVEEKLEDCILKSFVRHVVDTRTQGAARACRDKLLPVFIVKSDGRDFRFALCDARVSFVFHRSREVCGSALIFGDDRTRVAARGHFAAPHQYHTVTKAL